MRVVAAPLTCTAYGPSVTRPMAAVTGAEAADGAGGAMHTISLGDWEITAQGCSWAMVTVEPGVKP